MVTEMGKQGEAVDTTNTIEWTCKHCGCSQNCIDTLEITEIVGVRAKHIPCKHCGEGNYIESGLPQPLSYEPGWKPFDATPLLGGTYWICGTYPEYDIDLDDDGTVINIPTGKDIEFVSLVEILPSMETEESYSISPVNACVTGGYDYGYNITQYAEFEPPKTASIQAV